MALEITEQEQLIIDTLRQALLTLMREHNTDQSALELLRTHEIELVQQLRQRIGGAQFYLPKSEATRTQYPSRHERDHAIRSAKQSGKSLRWLANRHSLSKSQIHSIINHPDKAADAAFFVPGGNP